MREEQAAQCMPLMSKRKGQALSVVVLMGSPLVIPYGGE
jgi:hypothetical protein